MDRKLENTLTRRKTLFIGLAALLLGIIAYGVASFMYWQTYAADVSKHEQAKTAVEKALDKQASTSSERVAKLAALTSASESLFASSTSCKPAWWVAWQQVLPVVSAQIEHCEEVAEKHKAVRTALETVQNYIESEGKLIAVLAPLAKLSTKLTEKTWDTSASEWENVSDGIDSLDVSSDFHEVKQETSKQLQKIVSAWKKLVAADKKEDSADFAAAYDALDRAITDLIAVADLSEDELNTLTRQLEAAANEL